MCGASVHFLGPTGHAPSAAPAAADGGDDDSVCIMHELVLCPRSIERTTELCLVAFCLLICPQTSRMTAVCAFHYKYPGTAIVSV